MTIVYPFSVIFYGIPGVSGGSLVEESSPSAVYHAGGKHSASSGFEATGLSREAFSVEKGHTHHQKKWN